MIDVYSKYDDFITQFKRRFKYMFSDGFFGYIQSVIWLGLMTPLIYFLHTGFISILKRESGSGDQFLSLFFSPLVWIWFFTTLTGNGPEILFGVGGLTISSYIVFKKLTDESWDG